MGMRPKKEDYAISASKRLPAGNVCRWKLNASQQRL
ncbi:MAG: hypothetical protein GDYSWBUE_001659, partial [Candidatus Fervidibacterota bacterium]